jgi:hypothetical protein
MAEPNGIDGLSVRVACVRTHNPTLTKRRRHEQGKEGPQPSARGCIWKRFQMQAKKDRRAFVSTYGELKRKRVRPSNRWFGLRNAFPAAQ